MPPSKQTSAKQMPVRKPGRKSTTTTTTPALRAGEELGIEASGRYSSSLVAGLAILDCFTPERRELGIATLATELNMSRSTTHRYASTLVALGYLEQDDSRRYRLAPRVADLGLSLLDSMALRRAGREHLRQLREQTGRTVVMAILDGCDIVYIEVLRGWRRGQYASNFDAGVGVRLPSYCSALGKVLLAHLPDEQREPLISSLKLTRRAPNTITSKRELRAELERVRENGLGVSDEEALANLRTIAAPVVDERGEVPAAVGISAPSDTVSRERLVATLGPLIAATAKRISATLQRR